MIASLICPGVGTSIILSVAPAVIRGPIDTLEKVKTYDDEIDIPIYEREMVL